MCPATRPAAMVQPLESATGSPPPRAKPKSRRPPLAKQSQSPVTIILQSLLAAWAVHQHLASGDSFSLKDVAYVLVASYLYCDFWLWMLHCFLDRKENLTSKIEYVKFMAISFQGHHDFPGKLLADNHLSEIDLLVSATAATGLLLGPWTSPATKLVVVGVGLWGALGALNHFYGHAITQRYHDTVPAFYKYAQQWGLLPTARHHKVHHSAPHEENWNFLNGLHWCVYEPLYFATGSRLAPLFAMFYTLNPVGAQLIGVTTGLFA